MDIPDSPLLIDTLIQSVRCFKTLDRGCQDARWVREELMDTSYCERRRDIGNNVPELHTLACPNGKEVDQHVTLNANIRIWKARSACRKSHWWIVETADHNLLIDIEVKLVSQSRYSYLPSSVASYNSH